MSILKNVNIDIIEELDLEDIPENKKQKLRQTMESNLSSRLEKIFLSRLDGKEKVKLKEILDRDGNSWSFIRKHVPDAESILNEKV